MNNKGGRRHTVSMTGPSREGNGAPDGGGESTGTINSDSRKVLIVEHSAVQAEMYRLAFSKRRAELIFAANGPEAMAVLAREPRIDLLISDINMPEGNGAELLATVKGTTKFPIIAIGARANLVALEDAVRNQVATHYLLKPWNLRQMRELIGQVLPE